MHTFQPYPIDLIEMNPFTKFGKEWALVTSGSKAKCNTMTVSWGVVRDSRYTKEFIDQGEFFSLAFLDDTYKSALSYCGAHSGRTEDKFAKAGLTPAFRHSIPYPDEANFVLLCRKMAAVPMPAETFTDKSIAKDFYKDGDFHTMYVGEIIEAMAR